MAHASVTTLRGVRVHNLKNIDVDIPLGRLTVVTGVSGAGKTSLVLDTLHAESQRRFLQGFSVAARQMLDRFVPPDAEKIGDLPPSLAVASLHLGGGTRATVGGWTEITAYLRLLFSRAGVAWCDRCSREVRPQTVREVLEKVAAWPPGRRFSVAFPVRFEPTEAADRLASLREDGFVRLRLGNQVFRIEDMKPGDLESVPETEFPLVLLDRLETGRLDTRRLTDSLETAFARGGGRLVLAAEEEDLAFDRRRRCTGCGGDFPEPQPRLFDADDPVGACPTCRGLGTLPRREEVCPDCAGRRFNDQARAFRFAGASIDDLLRRTVEDVRSRLGAAGSSEADPQVRLLLDQIDRRLGLLQEAALDYLTLDRTAATLSAGESRRVRLTSALASNLVQALYVLDEPTQGLHAAEIDRVLKMILRLREAGNTVVAVEHHAAVVRAANHVVDLGPGAGEEGGRVLFQGPPGDLAEVTESATGDYLFGRRSLTSSRKRRAAGQGHLRLVGARKRNLQDLTVDFPLGLLCVVTGVSGAGKSTLVEDTLYPALLRRKKKAPLAHGEADVLGTGQIGDVVLMDQSPPARSSRSNPATYLKVFDEIRAVFAAVAEAKIRGFDPGAFSFNQPGGRCDACEGQGETSVDMQFLPDVVVTCPICRGARYKKEVLQVKVRSLNIAQVLDLTAREAFRFFRAQPRIERKLKHLLDVGLDYLRLGQRLDTLSGGEAQRLKLAGHLASSRKPRTLFLLIEPASGLHPADVARLLDCFDRLLEAGHSLLLVEHDLDVIAAADHLVDLGPGGGPHGGRLVAVGTPEEVAGNENSATGRALAEYFSKEGREA